MLRLCHSFLKDRQSRNLVNSYVSEWYESPYGVPQGSILSVIFFLVHTSDLTGKSTLALPPPKTLDVNSEVDSEFKYADDYSAWEAAFNLEILKLLLQKVSDNVASWCKKWRLSLNLSKTKIMLVGNDNTHHQDFDIFFEDFLIPIVESNTMLGIEVDNKLTFSHHIDQICANGKRANNTLSALKNLKIDLLAKLYKMLSRSRLEYGTLGIKN